MCKERRELVLAAAADPIRQALDAIRHALPNVRLKTRSDRDKYDPPTGRFGKWVYIHKTESEKAAMKWEYDYIVLTDDESGGGGDTVTVREHESAVADETGARGGDVIAEGECKDTGKESE